MSTNSNYYLCVYIVGKTIENARGRFNMVLATEEDTFSRLVADPLYDSHKVVNESMTAVFLKQKKVILNKPIIVGFTILELSKLLLFRDYYEVFKPHFRTMTLLMTDTDSCLIEVSSSNLSNDLQTLKSNFDFSNYESDHPLYDPSRKNQAGLWKNEIANGTITEFCGLKSKSYAFKTIECKTRAVHEKITCKGVNKGGKKSLHMHDYFKCIKSVASIRADVMSIRSSTYVLSTLKLNKLALSSFDDKRHLFSCGVHTAPYESTLIHRYNDYCPFCDPTFFQRKSNIKYVNCQ